MRFNADKLGLSCPEPRHPIVYCVALRGDTFCPKTNIGFFAENGNGAQVLVRKYWYASTGTQVLVLDQ